MSFLNPGTGHPLQAPQSIPPTVHWRGSQQVYGFQLHQIGVSYLERPGVYIFCRRAPNGNWDPVYVGETDNFSRRLTTALSTISGKAFGPSGPHTSALSMSPEAKPCDWPSKRICVKA